MQSPKSLFRDTQRKYIKSPIAHHLTRFVQISKTPIKDLVIIIPDVYKDNRGFFLETYNEERYRSMGIDAKFVQDNMSRSSFGVTRGLHFQIPPHTQSKLVSCVVGKVWDVAVDLRQKSPTYRQWYGIELSEENHQQFFIPQGFGHGFVTLSPFAIITYKCDNLYNAHSDAGIHILDPDINIPWPIREEEMILSDKDRQRPLLSQICNPF